MSKQPVESRIVQLTPPGRGAVATLLIEGPRACESVVELLWLKSGKKPRELPADRPIFAHFGSENGEEVVVRRRKNAADRSDSLEIHCHGGRAATEAVVKAFLERGFSLVPWKAWIEGTTDDPIAAAAHIALADARTERTAAILLDQYRGALSRAFNEIERGEWSPAQIEQLLERAPLGLHLTKPWRVAIVGEPNVGKSSLLNALLGYCRAIVHHSPGTTRDVVAVQTACDGWPVELRDTAGLRELEPSNSPSDSLEQAGIELTKREIADADLLLLVFDASKPMTAEDQKFLDKHPRSLVIHNKVDLASRRDDRPGGIFVSATTGEGIEELPQQIAQCLVPQAPLPGVAVPFNEEQIVQLWSFFDR